MIHINDTVIHIEKMKTMFIYKSNSMIQLLLKIRKRRQMYASLGICNHLFVLQNYVIYLNLNDNIFFQKL